MNNQNLESETNAQRVEKDTYDLNIVPAETAARKEREGKTYKQLPEDEEDNTPVDGYTMDGEGLINNYAVEPEMYYETPGDAQELEDVNEADDKGKLRPEDDTHSKDISLT